MFLNFSQYWCSLLWLYDQFIFDFMNWKFKNIQILLENYVVVFCFVRTSLFTPQKKKFWYIFFLNLNIILLLFIIIFHLFFFRIFSINIQKNFWLFFFLWWHNLFTINLGNREMLCTSRGDKHYSFVYKTRFCNGILCTL